eukprot:9881356-Lingulodinium_polyedra.AAC.1
MEQPEGLGAIRGGPWDGQRPASMWQHPEVNKLCGEPNMRTVGFLQSDFGAPYAKPTRLLLSDHFQQDPRMPIGPPFFSSQGRYLGP